LFFLVKRLIVVLFCSQAGAWEQEMGSGAGNKRWVLELGFGNKRGSLGLRFGNKRWALGQGTRRGRGLGTIGVLDLRNKN